MKQVDLSLVYVETLNTLVYIFNKFALQGYHVALRTASCKCYLSEIDIFVDSKEEAHSFFGTLNAVYGSTFTVKLSDCDSYYCITINQ